MLVTAGSEVEGRPGLRSAGAICRNLGQNYWRIRHEWSREDDYMSLPVLRLRRQSCLGRPEVAGAALISVTVNVARERRGAMLRGFCSGGPQAVLETPVGARCEGCA